MYVDNEAINSMESTMDPPMNAEYHHTAEWTKAICSDRL